MASVLIVEDNRDFRRSLKEILKGEFPTLEIIEAADGEEALRKIHADPPHLVFMDIKLPGENGLRVTQKIKTEFPELTVVILTSYDLPEYREAALQSKANHFIVKGQPTNEILRVVRSVVPGQLQDSTGKA